MIHKLFNIKIPHFWEFFPSSDIDLTSWRALTFLILAIFFPIYALNALPLMHILTYFVYFVLKILQHLQKLPVITINKGLTFHLAFK